MLPNSLLLETIAQTDGCGPVADVSQEAGKLLVLTLGITRIIEQESLDVSIWGSRDQTDWGAEPLASFPQKFYCGMYSILLNLSAHPEIKYLHVRWKMNRWTKGNLTPLFEFYVHAEASGTRVRAASAGSNEDRGVATRAIA
ncbi:MAG: hypothetical protein M3Z32_04470 [Acidobacteriota bacterium]|nr:hypothetical protein [Acidobacteriota bacterium]